MKNFPVNSTSVQTAPCARACVVLRRAKVAEVIDRGGVFSCRPVLNSKTYSQHAWGNAVDLFPKWEPQSHMIQDNLRRIAQAVVIHATRVTPANMGVKLKVDKVIDHDAQRQWTPSEGWHAYDGATGGHIHVQFTPYRTGKPACAS